MKRRFINGKTNQCGYYVNDFIRGFMGERKEGEMILRFMGLPLSPLPFSVIAFLQKRKIRWKDSDDNLVTLSYRLKPGQIECSATYLEKKKTMRLFLEWGAHEDRVMVTKLESEAIGDLCMRCLYENFDLE